MGGGAGDDGNRQDAGRRHQAALAAQMERLSEMRASPTLRDALKRSETQLTLINQLLRTLDPFFKLRTTMPARAIQAYLLVAQKEGQSVTELAKAADLPITTMSRNLLDMGDRNRYFEEGAGLVVGEDNPFNRREKLYSLTPKGRALLASTTKTAAGP